MEKKQPIGEYYQEGRGYCTESRKVNDHDFAEEIVNSYGIYDIKRNEGYMTLGTSKETSEFACDCIKGWWERYGKIQYPKASNILITADGGGSNSSRHYIFKEDLQKLANEIGVTIRMAHYPPYTSKYNPIEHRLFCHVTRACSKTVVTSVELLKELIQKTSTSTGLKVFASIIDKISKTARKASPDFRKHMPIVADTYLGQWNYRAVPQAV